MSDAYAVLRAEVVTTVEATCGCIVDEVVFECGSIRVIVIMQLAEDVDLLALIALFVELASRLQLPPFNSVIEPGLGITLASIGK